MTSPSIDSRAVVAWMEVLDRIEHQLGESLVADGEPSTPPGPATNPDALLQQSDARLADLQASLERAEGNAATIDALLKEEAEHLRSYLDSVGKVARKLADWASRAV
jgi:hypothetical protein